MATDKTGKAIEVGDEIVIRGRVVAIPVEHNGIALLHVDWHDQVPLLNFVQASKVEVDKGRK